MNLDVDPIDPGNRCSRCTGLLDARTWSWWRFLLGVAVLPAAMALLVVVINVIQ
jgi:hypothetical protein